MRFYIVHELRGISTPHSGRMRVRASCPLGLAQAEALAGALATVPGISEIRVNPRLGSLLFHYEDAESRETALTLFVGAGGVDGPLAGMVDDPAPGPGEATLTEGLMPVFQYVLVRPLLPMALRIVNSVVSAVPFLFKGVRAVLRGALNVDVLDAAAIGASLIMRDFRTVSLLTLLLGLGETLEYWTRRRSMATLTESLALNVENVWLLADGTEISVPLAQVKEGDLVVVRDGGSIPVDGVVEEGYAMVNQSSMTGEPLGVRRTTGASVFAGTVVEEGRLVIRARHVGDGTRLRQVVKFIEESESLKAGIQGKYERLADMAVPFTFGLAALVWLLTRDFRRAASVLLVDYSCALKLATPLAVLASMREGARHGMAIKGGRYLEALNEADTVVFDKTGTLTQASPEVVEVFPAPGFERTEVLRVMACLEEHFPHPVARAVVRKADEEGLKHAEEHAHVEYVVAHGVASSLYGKKMRVGSRHYIEHDEDVDLSPLEAVIEEQTGMGRSLLFMSEDGRVAGMVSIEDPMRPEAPRVVEELRSLGFNRVLMLTGDDERTARAVAARVGISEYRAQVLPTDKARIVQELTEQGCRVLMVGDGINDAPALSASHVGVAMSDGTDLAREVANVLLTHPNLEGLVNARLLGTRTLRRIHFNFVATLTLNSAFLLGGLFMFMGPGVAALLHNVTTLGVALNAMRPHLPTKALPGEESHFESPASS
ncbi:heavy metal translocating P-type ATPase [Desulfovibrio sp. 86]|uniref:P-type Zn(2+) transporter n=1 Tax=uncultured Desulfovibrio sp. TaxID=167968 RepID=A0A212L0Z8_9BACT|nr:heavy metal translocating P-type ATPase [Desulfovibrio sp. 86]SCM71049.1 Heavy metal translocating P-type ATPase [uncultured Desulfovibrio sp.]VZH32699.1 Heavy metal translocating P-type ATPase [Desulfovibrio sp. 86]